jgi:hypothetical protein
MVTTRTSAIRFGSTYSWPVKSAELGFFYSNFDLKLRSFFSDFFSQSVVLSIGVGLSGVLLRRFSNRIVVEVFLQDAKLLDWISTRPGFKLKRLRLPSAVSRVRSFKKRYGFARRAFFKLRPFSTKPLLFFKKYRTYISARRYSLRRRARAAYKSKFFRRRRKHFRLRRQSKLSRYLALRRYAARLPKYKMFRFILRPKKRRVGGRLTRHFGRRSGYSNRSKLRRRSTSRPSFRFGPRFFRSFSKFTRFRFFAFFGRFASILTFFQLGMPVLFRLNFIGRSASVDFFLNYITTKLYYRYILNDIISPIVRISLKHYRGFRIVCRGRFTRAQIATERVYRRGALRLSSSATPVSYGQRSVVLKYGTCNLKIWLRF